MRRLSVLRLSRPSVTLLSMLLGVPAIDLASDMSRPQDNVAD
jgi:hypothetical protein